MKSFSPAPDVETVVNIVQGQYHEDLGADTRVGTLFVFDLEATEPVLKHQGYPAAAVVRIEPLRNRAQGMADATIVVDRATWMIYSPRQRAALIDHELTHLERVVDEETEAPKFDALDRPKLRMRRHDHQFGWFDAIAERHGDASGEVKQARQMLEQTGQLYFDFGPAKKAA